MGLCRGSAAILDLEAGKQAAQKGLDGQASDIAGGLLGGGQVGWLATECADLVFENQAPGGVAGGWDEGFERGGALGGGVGQRGGLAQPG